MVAREALRTQVASLALQERIRKPMPLEQIVEGMISRPLTVDAKDAVFVRSIVEASEGLAMVTAERGGDLVLVAPKDRTAELDALVRDLSAELGLDSH